MADNYLERRMEEYRSGNLARRAVRGVGRSIPPKGKITVDFPPRIVIVVGQCDTISQSIVSRFISAGCKTAFCSIDRKEGASLSQSSGARFYPVKNLDIDCLTEVIEDVTKHWGTPDTLIINGEGSLCGTSVPIEERIIPLLDSRDGKLRVIEVVTTPDFQQRKSGVSDIGDGNYNFNRIVARERNERCGETVSSLCVFICEPCGRFLAGQMFEVD